MGKGYTIGNDISQFILYLITAAFAFTLLTSITNYGNAAATIETNNSTNTSTVVEVGGGNATMTLSGFLPQTVEINAGESVTWINPTQVPEPHTVTFVLSNETYADIFAPFAADNATQFASVPPNSNSEPSIIPQGPEGTKLVVALNDKAFSPFIINAEGKEERLPLKANYTITGAEKYINSGTMTPQGLTPPTWSPINQFTATFENTGTYDYLCVFHPWMTGRMVIN